MTLLGLIASVTPFCLRPLAIILPSGLLLSGCLTAVAPETVYRMTSDPEGAEIYAGIGPDDLGYYVTTPYERRTTQTLNWSGRYFQARKAGYLDSEIHYQLSSVMGGTVHIHFDLAPNATPEDFEPYRQRNTVEAYYDFLDQYPDAPFEDEVLQHLVDRIAERPDAAEQYRALLDAYPDAVPLVLERQLADLASRNVANVPPDPVDHTTDISADDDGTIELDNHTATGSSSTPTGNEVTSGSQTVAPASPSVSGVSDSGKGNGIVEWTYSDGQTGLVNTALRRDYIGIYETQHTHNSIPHFRVTLFASGELTLCWREVSQNTWSSVDSATTPERGLAFADINEWAPIVDNDGQLVTRKINNPGFPQADRLGLRSVNGDFSVNELLHARGTGSSNFSEVLRPFARQAMFAVHKIADIPPNTVVECTVQ